MKASPVMFLGLLLPSLAVAGPQYTAADVIRYFQQSNSATAPSNAAPETASAASQQGAVVMGNPANATRKRVVIGPTEDEPLVIPMTGAKAGYALPPAQPAASSTGYDLLVTFELNSATLTPQARANLGTFAQALQDSALAGFRFAVEGHTDSSGPADYNLKLSEARAASVVTYLVSAGVAPERLTSAGFGETRPRLADPEHPDNRRVETRRLE